MSARLNLLVNRMPRLWQPAALALIATFLAGCGRESATTYQVPKEKEASAKPGETAPTTTAPLLSQGAKPALHWQLPAGWEEQQPGEMRVGYFLIQGKNNQHAQVTIIPLGGLAGGDLENVNRWRGQLGLGPISLEEMGKLVEKTLIGSATGQLVDMAGAPPDETNKVHMLAAKVTREGTTWFFKMTGDDDLVKEQKPAFVTFLKNITFQAGAASPGPAKVPELTATPSPAQPIPSLAASGSDKPGWKVPAGWKEQGPGLMQTAKFTLGESGKGSAEVTVAAFPGDVGGIYANVNRWRGQLGLPPVDPAGLQGLTNAVDLGKVKATMVDLTGPTGANRLLVLLVSQAGQTWFYKISGDGAVVAREKEAFVGFVKSAVQ